MIEPQPSSTIVRIAGPVVGVQGLTNVCLHDVVLVGEALLVGEVIRLEGPTTIIQVYEDTSGVRIGERVEATNQPLVVQLGPGLLGRVFDGLQRPLETLAAVQGSFLSKGISISPLPKDQIWDFSARVQEGQLVTAGDVLGIVPETRSIQHKILVPPNLCGHISQISSGRFTLADTIAILEQANEEQIPLSMSHNWPVRHPRPVKQRLDPSEPLITGTRVIDLLFPVAKGGTAIIPGGFGTGKTVTQQSISRWSDVDIVVYVGCGERGNEMADVLEEFPKLEDPRTGTSLMERTILIANTSNMPVAARETSIYTGITLAEYYRDMGYHVLMLADSTSRWGEALREISGRLEEIPGEEGYPAYLASRISQFYERTGRVECLSGGSLQGSITLIGAVSPPGGDFSEPITQSSMRIAGSFWALDYDLSRQRHFPAINWNQSYSLYNFEKWYQENLDAEWNPLVRETRALLQHEDELLQIIQLVGQDSLSESEREVLVIARMIREDLLQQSAFHEVDRFCTPQKTYQMLKIIITYHHLAQTALADGKATLEQIATHPVLHEIARMKEIPINESQERLNTLLEKAQKAFDEEPARQEIRHD